MARVQQSKNEQGRRPMIFDVLPPLSKGRGFRFGEGKFSLSEKESAMEPSKKIAQVKKSFWQESRQGALVAVYIVGLVSLVFFLRQTLAALEDKTARVEFFANSVRSDGGWKNIDQALGEPQIFPEGDRDSFSAGNSAIYEGGRHSLIAENFTTREFIKIDVAAPTSSVPEIVIDSVPTPSLEVPAIETQSPDALVNEVVVASGSASVVEDVTPVSEEIPAETLAPAETPVTEEASMVVDGVENHLPVSEDVLPVAEPSSEVSAPVVSDVSGPTITESAPAVEASASEPVSKLDVLQKELAKIISPQAVKAQADITADDRDTVFGRFRSARVKISLAAFNKALESATPVELVPVEQVSIDSLVVSSSLATTTLLDTTSSSENIISTTSPITRLFQWLGFNKANAQATEENPKAVIWYSVGQLNGEESWQELYTVSANDLSNAENGGYLIFSAPFIKAWQDIDNLKIKFQGRTETGDNFVFYLDAVWVEADYDQASVAPKEKDEEGFDKDVLEVDGKKIFFQHTDENVDENLIIKTDRKNYFGLSNAEVYFSVENIGVRDEEINLQFYFPSATSGVVKLEKLEKNAPYISEAPHFEPKIFECANGWEKRETYYECYPTTEKQVCDVVSPNRRYCRIENFKAGAKQEIKYKNRWSEIGLSDFPLTNEKGFWQKVLALGPQQKEVPEELSFDKATRESVDMILPGEVRYYKAVIHFAPNSDGEFYIEAIGSKDGYGLLDPWWMSGWNFRLPITIDNRGGSNTLTDYQAYIQISSTTQDFWRNVKSNGGDIRFVDYAETGELNHWVQYFDYSASSTRIWVKVPYVAAASTTKIFLYYGNSSADSVSDQYTPFSYSSVQDLYKVVSVATSTSIQVVSLIDNNSVQVDGGTAVVLGRQGITTFNTYTASSTIKAKGPIGIKISGGPATAPAAPISFAATGFTLPVDRDLEVFNFLPVKGDSTVTLYDGQTQDWQQLIAAGESQTVINNIATDSLAVISATAPILVSLTTNWPGDGLIAYPPTNEDLYGVKSQYNIIAAHATSSFDILCSSGASSSVSALATASRQNNTTCSGGTEGNGNAVRLDVKSGSLSAIQQDDSDGRQETVFLPFREFGAEYMLPTDAAYFVAVCAPETGAVTLSIYDQDNFFIASSTCTPQGSYYPGTVRFGSDDASTYQAGTRIVSSLGKPFGVYYEDIEATGYAGGDETNLWGAVQARQYAYPDPGLFFGAHEVKGPPTASFNSATIRTDGSGRVDISIEVDDPTNDDCRAKLEYYADANCYGSPLNPTLSETDDSTIADFGDPKVFNNEIYQVGTSTGWIKTASGTNTVLLSWDSNLDIPTGNGTYCLKVTANDQLNDQFFPATTSLSIDNLPPSIPGGLQLSRKTGSTFTLSFGATSTDTNFRQYKIHYKPYDGTPVTSNDATWSSSSDADLYDVEFNGTATTTISGLSAGTTYTIDIFAYDQNGNKSSSTAALTLTANDAPTAYFNSVTQKIDGSGAIDISIEVDDNNNNNTVRAKLEYVSYFGGGHCDFTSPFDPSIDPSNLTSDFGSVQVDNDSAYQIGTTSFFILTSAGANTVNFDWLSKEDIGSATGTYCLRLTTNDGMDDQLVAATTTISIDNAPPQSAGNLVVGETAYNSIRLTLPYSQRAIDDNEPGANAYKVFYKIGSSGVTEGDSEYDLAIFDAYNFAGATSTLVSGLSQGNNYVFNIWAYDAYGNKSSSTEVSGATDGIVTNKGLIFFDPQSLGTSTNIAVASGTFTFRAQVQDSDGWGALDYIILRLANANDNSAPFDDLRFKWDRAGDTFTEIGADSSGMASIVPSSYSDCADGTCYLYFKLIFNKSFADTSTNYSAQLYSSDTDVPAHTDEDTYQNLFQIKKTWLDQIHYRWRNDDGGG